MKSTYNHKIKLLCCKSKLKDIYIKLKKNKINNHFYYTF